MRSGIFDNEEEYLEFRDWDKNICIDRVDCPCNSVHCTADLCPGCKIESAKRDGIIKISALEKAHKKWEMCQLSKDRNDVYNRLFDYMRELEKENRKLNETKD